MDFPFTHNMCFNLFKTAKNSNRQGYKQESLKNPNSQPWTACNICRIYVKNNRKCVTKCGYVFLARTLNTDMFPGSLLHIPRTYVYVFLARVECNKQLLYLKQTILNPNMHPKTAYPTACPTACTICMLVKQLHLGHINPFSLQYILLTPFLLVE